MLELTSATTTGSIDVAVYSDNSGAPGALFDDVDTLPGTAVHSSPFATDVPFATPFDLTADTNWWLGISSTNDPTASWVITEAGFMMEISGSDVAAAPEPGTWMLFAAGLGIVLLARLARTRRTA